MRLPQNVPVFLALLIVLGSAAAVAQTRTPAHQATSPDSDEQRIADLVLASRILVQEGVLDSFGHEPLRCALPDLLCCQ